MAANIADESKFASSKHTKLYEIYFHFELMIDSSKDTEKRGVPEEFRKIISFRSFEKKKTTPLLVSLISDVDGNTDIGVTMVGLQLTLQGVLWTAIDFFSASPVKTEEEVTKLELAALDRMDTGIEEADLNSEDEEIVDLVTKTIFICDTNRKFQVASALSLQNQQDTQ